MKKPLLIDGKPVNFYVSHGFNYLFCGTEAALYKRIACEVLTRHPVDMLVFEQPRKDRQRVRLAGYFLDGPKRGELDEETIAWSADSLETPTFWLKIDDEGESFTATFLMPEEY